jgi:hypothetical protein
MSAGPGWAYRAYLGLALVGAILPYAILIPWLARHGPDVRSFLAGPFANGPASIFSADVLFSAAVFLIFVAVEGRRLGMRGLWLPPLIVATIGLCCALPLFLAQRERVLAAR